MSFRWFRSLRTLIISMGMVVWLIISRIFTAVTIVMIGWECIIRISSFALYVAQVVVLSIFHV